jgi:serine O-acetyltransferase
VQSETTANTKNLHRSTWREDIQCVFERDPAARTSFEIVTTYPGVHAIMFHRLSHALWNRNLK